MVKTNLDTNNKSIRHEKNLFPFAGLSYSHFR